MNNSDLKRIQIIQTIAVAVAIVMMLLSIISLLMEPNPSVFMMVAQFELLTGLIISLVYLVDGYKKSAAVYYKATICFALLGNVLQIIGNIFMDKGIGWSGIISLITIACLTVLIMVKDLGENRTNTIFQVMMASVLGSSIFQVLAHGRKVIPSVIAAVLGAGTIGIMIRAKYLDKKARGSK